MRLCEECLDNLIKSMKKDYEPPMYENFNPKNNYYLNDACCDKCGTYLSEKMLKKWNDAEKVYKV